MSVINSEILVFVKQQCNHNAFLFVFGLSLKIKCADHKKKKRKKKLKDQLNKQHYLVLCSYHTHCVYILHMCDYEKPKKNPLEQTTRLRGYTMEVTL